MVELRDVSFTYAGGRDSAGLEHINLSVKKGETVLLCGKSGCGKTTITRLVNGLIPHYYEGELSGTVMVDDKSVPDTELYDMAKTVGSVFQNPRSQFFNVDTTSELAFGCENLGMPEEEVLSRIDRAADALSLRPLLDRSIFELSGGEKQRIACGSVSALEPEIVVLDEPTSNLDFSGIRELSAIIRRWRDEGKTVLIAEHRIHFLKGLVDRVLVLENGRITEEYSGTAFFEQPGDFYVQRGLRIPSLDYLHFEEAENESPLCQQELILKNLRYGYTKSIAVLDIPEAVFPAGVIAVIGHNGAGKTTFARSLCGLLKKDKGQLVYQGKTLTAGKRLSSCYMVMQDVNHQLFTESVIDEVLLSMKHENPEKAKELLAALDLSAYADDHPMSLSGGQKQRVAIASALAAGRDILLFDEPTSGLDFDHMRETAKEIQKLSHKGIVSLIVTHDPEFIACCCTHVLHIEGGELIENYPLDMKGQRRVVQFFEGGACHDTRSE